MLSSVEGAECLVDTIPVSNSFSFEHDCCSNVSKLDAQLEQFLALHASESRSCPTNTVLCFCEPSLTCTAHRLSPAVIYEPKEPGEIPGGDPNLLSRCDN